jgi:hypothetical protein
VWLICSLAAFLTFALPAAAQQGACASIYENLFASVYREFDRDDPSLEAIRSELDKVPEDVRCTAEIVAPIAVRSRHFEHMAFSRFLADGGRPLPSMSRIRVAKQQILVSIMFDSEGRFLRRESSARADQYTDDLPTSMPAAECLRHFKSLIALAEEGLSARREWRDLDDRLWAQLPLANCPIDEVRSAARDSKVFEQESSGGPTSEHPTWPPHYSFWFRRGQDRGYVDVTATLEHGGLAFRRLGTWAKPF